MMVPSKQLKYLSFDNGDWKDQESQVITETPVSLTVNGELWLTTLCTPVDLEAMAAGFLFNEGLIQSAAEIAQVRLCPTGDNVDIWTNIPLTKPEHWRRTSGCAGGLTSFPDHQEDNPETTIKNGGTLTAKQICHLIDFLFKEQALYPQTGGVHTSLLTDGEGEWIAAEDIGRHNTLDKIAGRCLFEQRKFKRRIVLTTGRISSEMLQKAARLGAAYVISRTSPSSLSIELANRYGITLVGYARRTRFNVYTNSHRIDPGVIEAGEIRRQSLQENG